MNDYIASHTKIHHREFQYLKSRFKTIEKVQKNKFCRMGKHLLNRMKKVQIIKKMMDIIDMI